MIANDTFKVGIYLRLSKEDEKKEESTSISNQRDIINKYLKDNNLVKIKEYVDDGISGTTFDRDGFNKMVNDIENKKINMVVTKDLSRFGRNEGQQLRYLDYFFDNNIRYVSILDNVDTFDEHNTSNEMIPIQCFFNEKHVRDTSKKMKASVYNKRNNGCFLGSTPPYGYKKDPNNKYKLIIDEESAEVVRRIFNLFISGKSISEISRILTDDNVLIPSIYKNLNRGLKSSAYGIWNNRTITDILTLPTYIGNLTQGRLKKPSYKSKKIIRTKKEEWIICKDVCPKIIDKETFDLAQNIYKRNKNKSKTNQDILLKGLVFCKECGHTIGFRKQIIETKTKGLVIRCYGSCNYYNKYKKYNLCTPHNVKYFELETLVLNEVRKIFNYYININNLVLILEKNDKSNKFINELKNKLDRLKQEENYSVKKIENLYNDKLDGVIDLDMFYKMKKRIEEENKKTKEEIMNISNKIIFLENKLEKRNYLKEIENCLENISIQLLSSIIKRIEIDENKKIDIYYAFKM